MTYPATLAGGSYTLVAAAGTSATAAVTVHASTTGTVDAAAVAVGTLAGHRLRVPAGRSAVVRVSVDGLPTPATGGTSAAVATRSAAPAPAETPLGLLP